MIFTILGLAAGAYLIALMIRITLIRGQPKRLSRANWPEDEDRP